MGQYFNMGISTVHSRRAQQHPHKIRRTIENMVRKELRQDAALIRDWIRESVPIATGAAAEGTMSDVSTPGKTGVWRLRFFGGRKRKSESIRYSRIKAMADLVPIPEEKLSPSAMEVYRALYPAVYAYYHLHSDEEVWQYWYIVVTKHSRVRDVLLNELWTKEALRRYAQAVALTVANITRAVLSGDDLYYSVEGRDLPFFPKPLPRKRQDRDEDRVIGLTISLIPEFFQRLKGRKYRTIREYDIKSFYREKFGKLI